MSNQTKTTQVLALIIVFVSIAIIIGSICIILIPSPASIEDIRKLHLLVTGLIINTYVHYNNTNWKK